MPATPSLTARMNLKISSTSYHFPALQFRDTHPVVQDLKSNADSEKKKINYKNK